MREELEWNRSRSIISSLVGKDPERIKELPILDAIQKRGKKEFLKESDQHKALQRLAKRIIEKQDGGN